MVGVGEQKGGVKNEEEVPMPSLRLQSELHEDGRHKEMPYLRQHVEAQAMTKSCSLCSHLSPSSWCFRISNRITRPDVTCAFYEYRARPEQKGDEKLFAPAAPAQPASAPKPKGPRPVMSGVVSEDAPKGSIGAQVGEIALWEVTSTKEKAPCLSGTIKTADGKLYRVALWKR